MNKIRAAVIGVGYFGNFHAEKYAAMPDVELVAVVDPDRDRAAQIAGRLGTRACADVAELAGAIDVASVAVPTERHYEVARALVDSGVHVLIEKPITRDLDEADRLLAAAAARGTIIQTGHVERFNPALAAVRDRITAPLFVESHRLAPFKPRATDVDVVLDLMIHDIDIILDLVPSEVKEVRASGISVLTERVDIANARIEFASGCVANVTASRVSDKGMRKIRVFQPNAYVSIDFQTGEATVASRVPGQTGPHGLPLIEHEGIEAPRGDPLAAEVRAFVDAVRAGGAPVVTGADGRRALAVALEIKRRITESRALVAAALGR